MTQRGHLTVIQKANSNETALTDMEHSRLIELEKVVEHGLKTFIEVGMALREIRENRLYRVTHSRFDDYVKERFDFRKDYANRVVKATNLIENIKNESEKNDANWHQKLPHVSEIPLPETESQCRPLTLLDEEAQFPAWIDAVSIAIEKGKMKPTASICSKVVRSRIKKDVKKEIKKAKEKVEAHPVYGKLPQAFVTNFEGLMACLQDMVDAGTAASHLPALEKCAAGLQSSVNEIARRSKIRAAS